MNPNDMLFTVPEAADYVRLRPSTIRSHVLRRKIAYVKIGRLVRIRRSECDALIERGTVPARAEKE
jgi:excisionase family DNA binding protein